MSFNSNSVDTLSNSNNERYKVQEEEELQQREEEH